LCVGGWVGWWEGVGMGVEVDVDVCEGVGVVICACDVLIRVCRNAEGDKSAAVLSGHAPPTNT